MPKIRLLLACRLYHKLRHHKSWHGGGPLISTGKSQVSLAAFDPARFTLTLHASL